MSHTRPDIVCGVNESKQVTADTFDLHSMEVINKIVFQVHEYPNRGILQQRLDVATLQIRIYTDGSFGDNDDQTTQLGYLILLCDKYNKCNIIQFTSHKSYRVVRSVLGSETIAFADGLDNGLALSHDLNSILQARLPIRLYTDSKSLFDVITKNSVISEKRLMVDVQAIREAYQRMEIYDVAWIRSEFNPANALTKIKENQVLHRVLDEGIIEHPVAQWVLRDTLHNCRL